MTIKQNANSYSYLMLLAWLAMVVGFIGFLLSLGRGVLWSEACVVLIVLGCTGFVAAVVPVWWREALDQAITRLPGERQALFAEAYHQQEELVMIEAHDAVMRAILPLRTTLYMVVAVYAAVVVIEPSAWGVITSSVVLAVLLTLILTELRASLARQFTMLVQRQE